MGGVQPHRVTVLFAERGGQIRVAMERHASEQVLTAALRAELFA